jgi:hypothetical protein
MAATLKSIASPPLSNGPGVRGDEVIVRGAAADRQARTAEHSVGRAVEAAVGEERITALHVVPLRPRDVYDAGEPPQER